MNAKIIPTTDGFTIIRQVDEYEIRFRFKAGRYRQRGRLVSREAVAGVVGVVPEFLEGVEAAFAAAVHTCKHQ